MASTRELTADQRQRYRSLYCGMCRGIRNQAGQLARIGLQYDCAFLALLLGSLYEPEERSGKPACMLHPLRHYTETEYTDYAAHMNVVLAYYKALDDWQDDGNRAAKFFADRLYPAMEPLQSRYPRQCQAIVDCLKELAELEEEGCNQPDLPAGCFGRLMAELMVYRQDHWEPYLRTLGDALGRFVYLADAYRDLHQDAKKGSYNPFLAAGIHSGIRDSLVRIMGRCTEAYEVLPLVQDKEILDNILYSGVWLLLRQEDGHGSL